MPITIQELISSDTISQAVNKINFNFDQLLLNGGGPVGPLGLPGPTGPAGGRGLAGATWYNDPAGSPGTDPNSLIIPTVGNDDYYLQANGAVWQYNDTTLLWVITPVNLTGPVGPVGTSIGFTYAGGYPGAASINNQNVAFIVPMPGGTLAGASQATNQGVSVALLGGVASTAIAPAGITFTSAFQIPDLMTRSLDTSVVSVLVHQKDGTSSSIKFMGGGVYPADKFEQNVIGNLSEISLGADDQLNITVPKTATAPSTLSDIIGFNLNTNYKGQQFYAGKQINFISGGDTTPSGLLTEHSDVTFTINTANGAVPAKFSVSTVSNTALFELGGNIVLPTSTIKTGRILSDANEIHILGNIVTLANITTTRFIRLNTSGINIASGPTQLNLTSSSTINLTSTTSAINISGTGTGGAVNINTNGTSSANIALLTNGAGQTTRFELGTVAMPTAPTSKTGRLVSEAAEIYLIGNIAQISNTPNRYISLNSISVTIENDATPINIISSAVGGVISIATAGTSSANIKLLTNGVGQTTRFELGTITLPTTTALTGKMLGAASEILLLGTTVRLANNNSSATIQLNASAIAMATTAATVPIAISTTGATSPVTISTTGTTSPVNISTADASNIVLSTTNVLADASIELGTLTFAGTTSKTGKIQVAAGDILLLGSSGSPGGVTLATNTTARFIKLDATGITIAHDAFTSITSKLKLTYVDSIAPVTQYNNQTAAPLNKVLVKIDSTDEVRDLDGYPLMPIGGIIMWSGTTLPYGWYLCNGQSVTLSGSGRGGVTIVTPNLLGKFIVGADNSSFPINTSGGNNNAVLSVANLPPHNHAPGTLNITSSGPHQHRIIWSTESSGDGNEQTADHYNSSSSIVMVTDTATPGYTGAHTHAMTDFAGITGPGAGTSDPFSILPPYYALAYIIYFGV